MKLYEVINKYNLTESTIKNWYKEKNIYDIEDISEYEIEKILKSKTTIMRNKKNNTNYLIPASYVSDNNIIKTISDIIEYKNKYNISNNEIIYNVIIKLLNEKKKIIPDEINRYFDIVSQNNDFINYLNSIEISY